MKHRIRNLVVGATGLLLISLFCRTVPDPSRIRMGDSESSVVALLGTPKEILDRPRDLARGENPFAFNTNSGECVREFVYHSRNYRTWHVGFNTRGQVVSSYGFRHRPARAVNVLARLNGPSGEYIGD